MSPGLDNRYNRSVVKVYPGRDELSRCLAPDLCWKCPVETCSFSTFKSVRGLKQHINSVHRQYQMLGKDGEVCQFHCPESDCCYGKFGGRWFSLFYQLKYHFQNSHEAKVFVCQRCGKGFGVQRDLTYHIRECGSQFSCQVCPVSYPSRRALLTHCSRKRHAIPERYVVKAGEKCGVARDRTPRQKPKPTPRSALLTGMLLPGNSNPVLFLNQYRPVSASSNHYGASVPMSEPPHFPHSMSAMDANCKVDGGGGKETSAEQKVKVDLSYMRAKVSSDKALKKPELRPAASKIDVFEYGPRTSPMLCIADMAVQASVDVCSSSTQATAADTAIASVEHLRPGNILEEEDASLLKRQPMAVLTVPVATVAHSATQVSSQRFMRSNYSDQSSFVGDAIFKQPSVSFTRPLSCINSAGVAEISGVGRCVVVSQRFLPSGGSQDRGVTFAVQTEHCDSQCVDGSMQTSLSLFNTHPRRCDATVDTQTVPGNCNFEDIVNASGEPWIESETGFPEAGICSSDCERSLSGSEVHCEVNCFQPNFSAKGFPSTMKAEESNDFDTRSQAYLNSCKCDDTLLSSQLYNSQRMYKITTIKSFPSLHTWKGRFDDCFPLAVIPAFDAKLDYDLWNTCVDKQIYHQSPDVCTMDFGSETICKRNEFFMDGYISSFKETDKKVSEVGNVLCSELQDLECSDEQTILWGKHSKHLVADCGTAMDTSLAFGSYTQTSTKRCNLECIDTYSNQIACNVCGPSGFHDGYAKFKADVFDSLDVDFVECGTSMEDLFSSSFTQTGNEIKIVKNLPKLNSFIGHENHGKLSQLQTMGISSSVNCCSDDFSCPNVPLVDLPNAFQKTVFNDLTYDFSAHTQRSSELSTNLHQCDVGFTSMHTQTADDLLDFLMSNMETQTADDISDLSNAPVDTQTQTLVNSSIDSFFSSIDKFPV